MIPEELYSTYSWYKKYTKTITTYSASKGQQCGYQLESFREKIKESIRVTYSFRHRHPWPLSKSTTGCDLEHAASINVADWHQKEAESEDKDTASKESELIRGFSRQRVRSGKQSQNETTDIFTTTPPPRSCPTPTSSKRDEQKGLVDLPVNLRIRC
jgi:hypothetical protein